MGCEQMMVPGFCDCCSEDWCSASPGYIRPLSPHRNPEVEQKPEVRVNHVGIGAENERQFEAWLVALRALGLEASAEPAEGHQRAFFELGDGVRLELQCWDKEHPQLRRLRVHLDVESNKPIEALERVGKVEDWGEGEVPRGMAVVDGQFVIMARQQKD